MRASLWLSKDRAQILYPYLNIVAEDPEQLAALTAVHAVRHDHTNVTTCLYFRGFFGDNGPKAVLRTI
ncbi:hypothetical protein GCM10009655_04910 [Rhodoglobus aureus]|uniref:Uncharacterized protein n=1 Tax=Rhodoglobus aureus TaxID=191497 RepID=A0ABP4G2K4_9MICO